MGQSWHRQRDLESVGSSGYAYPSVNFAGDRLLLTYWVRGPEATPEATPQRLYMKFRSVPVRESYAEE